MEQIDLTGEDLIWGILLMDKTVGRNYSDFEWMLGKPFSKSEYALGDYMYRSYLWGNEKFHLSYYFFDDVCIGDTFEAMIIDAYCKSKKKIS